MNALTEEKIQEYIDCAIECSAYDREDSILSRTQTDANRSVILGKKISALAKYFINNDLDEFIKLLDNENIAVAESVAEYLYPLYPKKCMIIYKKYLKTLNGDLERYRVKTIINSLIAKNQFDIEIFKKLFNCDDLSKLNREK